MTNAGKLRLIAWILVGMGLEMNIRGQMQGTASHTPDPASRMVWAVVPFVIFAVALYRAARTTLSACIGVVCAVLLLLLSTTYTNDEMRLTYVMIPIVQIIIVLIVAAALWLSGRWQAARRGES